jgi:hypothetical protein
MYLARILVLRIFISNPWRVAGPRYCVHRARNVIGSCINSKALIACAHSFLAAIIQYATRIPGASGEARERSRQDAKTDQAETAKF